LPAWTITRVSVVEDADVGAAHGDRLNLQQGRVVVDLRVFDLLDDDHFQRFKYGSFHGLGLSD
jgi:hypothetical protein